MGLAAAIVAVFGVAIPHAWAAHAGDKVVTATFGVLRALRYALYPISAVMEAFDTPIRRLAGAQDRRDENGNAAKQEILQAATNGQAEGAVDADEVEMIESVIEFGDRVASEIMTPRTEIFSLPADTPWQLAVEKIVEAGHTRVPIYEGDIDNIIGVLYAKDMLRYIAEPNPPPLRQIMRKCYFVPETKPLDDLLKEFKARKVHLAVVLDEYGGTAGLVTIEDVIEEIVGEISDEYDRAPPALMKRLAKRSAEVDGRMHIDDLNDAMKLNIPEDEDYDTVAGLVFYELGYIPKEGDTLEAYGARFTVLAADERRITRLKVDVLETKDAEQP
jgi:CBS domain containing-hemolysin-like protein